MLQRNEEVEEFPSLMVLSLLQWELRYAMIESNQQSRGGLCRVRYFFLLFINGLPHRIGRVQIYGFSRGGIKLKSATQNSHNREAKNMCKR